MVMWRRWPGLRVATVYAWIRSQRIAAPRIASALSLGRRWLAETVIALRARTAKPVQLIAWRRVEMESARKVSPRCCAPMIAPLYVETEPALVTKIARYVKMWSSAGMVM